MRTEDIESHFKVGQVVRVRLNSGERITGLLTEVGRFVEIQNIGLDPESGEWVRMSMIPAVIRRMDVLEDVGGNRAESEGPDH